MDLPLETLCFPYITEVKHRLFEHFAFLHRPFHIEEPCIDDVAFDNQRGNAVNIKKVLLPAILGPTHLTAGQIAVENDAVELVLFAKRTFGLFERPFVSISSITVRASSAGNSSSIVLLELRCLYFTIRSSGSLISLASGIGRGGW